MFQRASLQGPEIEKFSPLPISYDPSTKKGNLLSSCYSPLLTGEKETTENQQPREIQTKNIKPCLKIHFLNSILYDYDQLWEKVRR